MALPGSSLLGAVHQLAQTLHGRQPLGLALTRIGTCPHQHRLILDTMAVTLIEGRHHPAQSNSYDLQIHAMMTNRRIQVIHF